MKACYLVLIRYNQWFYSSLCKSTWRRKCERIGECPHQNLTLLSWSENSTFPVYSIFLRQSELILLRDYIEQIPFYSMLKCTWWIKSVQNTPTVISHMVMIHQIVLDVLNSPLAALFTIIYSQSCFTLIVHGNIIRAQNDSRVYLMLIVKAKEYLWFLSNIFIKMFGKQRSENALGSSVVSFSTPDI